MIIFASIKYIFHIRSNKGESGYRTREISDNKIECVYISHINTWIITITINRYSLHSFRICECAKRLCRVCALRIKWNRTRVCKLCLINFTCVLWFPRQIGWEKLFGFPHIVLHINQLISILRASQIKFGSIFLACEYSSFTLWKEYKLAYAIRLWFNLCVTVCVRACACECVLLLWMQQVTDNCLNIIH